MAHTIPLSSSSTARAVRRRARVPGDQRNPLFPQRGFVVLRQQRRKVAAARAHELSASPSSSVKAGQCEPWLWRRPCQCAAHGAHAWGVLHERASPPLWRSSGRGGGGGADTDDAGGGDWWPWQRRRGRRNRRARRTSRCPRGRARAPTSRRPGHARAAAAGASRSPAQSSSPSTPTCSPPPSPPSLPSGPSSSTRTSGRCSAW